VTELLFFYPRVTVLLYSYLLGYSVAILLPAGDGDVVLLPECDSVAVLLPIPSLQ
jgi:hypothetical protein